MLIVGGGTETDAGGPAAGRERTQVGGFVWSLDGPRVALEGDELMRACWHVDGSTVFTGSSQGKIDVRSAADGALATTLDTRGAAW